MYPGISLSEALLAIDNEECQRVIRIVAVLNQQLSAWSALHGNQAKGRYGGMLLQPTRSAAAEVAQAVKDNQSSLGLHWLAASLVLPQQTERQRDLRGRPIPREVVEEAAHYVMVRPCMVDAVNEPVLQMMDQPTPDDTVSASTCQALAK